MLACVAVPKQGRRRLGEIGEEEMQNKKIKKTGLARAQRMKIISVRIIVGSFLQTRIGEKEKQKKRKLDV